MPLSEKQKKAKRKHKYSTAKQRAKVFAVFIENDENITATAEQVGISKSVLHRWVNVYAHELEAQRNAVIDEMRANIARAQSEGIKALLETIQATRRKCKDEKHWHKTSNADVAKAVEILFRITQALGKEGAGADGPTADCDGPTKTAIRAAVDAVLGEPSSTEG